MKIDELYTNLVEERLDEDISNISSHALWMARVIIELSRDPAYKKLHWSLREEIERIVAAVE